MLLPPSSTTTATPFPHSLNLSLLVLLSAATCIQTPQAAEAKAVQNGLIRIKWPSNLLHSLHRQN